MHTQSSTPAATYPWARSSFGRIARRRATTAPAPATSGAGQLGGKDPGATGLTAAAIQRSGPFEHLAAARLAAAARSERSARVGGWLSAAQQPIGAGLQRVADWFRLFDSERTSRSHGVSRMRATHEPARPRIPILAGAGAGRAGRPFAGAARARVSYRVFQPTEGVN